MPVYEDTWESVRTHQVPAWYNDAKLGIFVHWGLYSVPGWAPQVPDIQALLRTSGPRRMLRDNPYAEWYLNSMRIADSPTQRHHRAIYGADYPYDNFRETFDAASAGADLGAVADLCRSFGARYVVLTTKHHEGFTLWPTSVPHPVKGHYHSQRDLVGELTAAVRAQGMRMGLYYSGGYDWPYNGAVMRRPADAVLAVPPGDDYAAYVTAHVRELIDRYQPSVLWNDIAWPSAGNLAALFAHFYNTVDEGVVNDRWVQNTLPRNWLTDALLGGAGDLLQALWRFIPDKRKTLTFAGARHYDFRTPEYAQLDHIAPRKWEATRGVGHSFGANRNERPEDIITAPALIHSLCDIVAKNGNLLIGIGPRPDGTIPAEQQAPLRGLGEWLAVNGVAIFGSRPWKIAAGTTSVGVDVRFTQRNGVVYAMLLGEPATSTFTLQGFDPASISSVDLLGYPGAVEWAVGPDALQITLPERRPRLGASVLSLGAGVVPLVQRRPG